ncbi:MAG: hypothetical protein CSA81_03950 [Acidobacteria bacterium]|nr:MAG: hypothetical protein CSA81_03950 [Acidobacteriota bacterium]
MKIEQIQLFFGVIIYLLAPLFVASKWRRLRGVLFHIFIMLLFTALGSGLLCWGWRLYNDHNLLAGLIVLLISANVFLGVPVFAYLAYRDSRDTISDNIQTILNSNRDEHLALSIRKMWSALLLIPKASDSHQLVFSGKHWLKNVNGFNFARLLVTNKRLFVQSLFFAMPLMDLQIKDIKEVGFHDADRGILKLETAKSTTGAYVKLFHGKASLQGTLYLNVGKHSEECRALIEKWIRE